MKSNKKPTSIEYLKSILDYNPSTGVLVWRKRGEGSFATLLAARCWNAKYPGKEAGTKWKRYIKVWVEGRGQKAHRIAWAIYHGNWPEGQIDHINGVFEDNRISNLRVVSNSLNQRNTAMRSNNTSGVNGVYYREKYDRWVASICLNGKNKHIGYFKTIEEAAKARKEEAEKHGYTDRHATQKRHGGWRGASV